MSFTFAPIAEEQSKKLDKIFGVENALFQFNPGKCLMPYFYKDIAQKILDFQVRSDDIWLNSYARTGSTWCQEIIWLIGNNLDFETAQNTVQQVRAPLLESTTVFYEYLDQLKDVFGNSIEYIDKLPSPRYIKSHLPYDLLPTQLDKVKPKIIYTMRNPKDVCVSYYHHNQLIHNLNTTFEDFCDLFLQDLVPLGSIWNHYLSMWNRRHQSNILIVKYEEMNRDLKGVIRKIADFLDKPLKEAQVDAIANFLSFKKMRQNKGCNIQYIVDNKYGEDFYQKSEKHFIRKGIVGDWKNCMSSELAKRFDEWIEANTKGTGLNFED